MPVTRNERTPVWETRCGSAIEYLSSTHVPQEKNRKRWRKSTCCFLRGPRLSIQHPHGSSQPPLTPIPGDPVCSFGLFRHQAYPCTQCTYIHEGKPLTHTSRLRSYLHTHTPHHHHQKPAAATMCCFLGSLPIS